MKERFFFFSNLGTSTSYIRNILQKNLIFDAFTLLYLTCSSIQKTREEPHIWLHNEVTTCSEKKALTDGSQLIKLATSCSSHHEEEGNILVLSLLHAMEESRFLCRSSSRADLSSSNRF